MVGRRLLNSARLRIGLGKGEEVIEDKSFKQSVEYARGKFTGMDCGVYDERGTSLSVIGLERSVTGVYVLPSAVTGVFLNREAIAKSGIKVLSIENCSNLRKFEIQNPTNPMVESPLWELTLVLPKEAPCLSKVAVNLICHKFRLIGECKGIDLSLYLCSELEINKSVMDNAKSLYFSSCSGIARICLPETNIADSVYLVNTAAAEHLSCHLRSNGLGITNCCKLKVMSVWFERLDAHLFSGYTRRRIISLEEIHIKVSRLFFSEICLSHERVIDFSYVSRVLKTISFTTADCFRASNFDFDKKYTLIIPSKADFTMSEELEPYFKVVRV